jgi:hypothetical protein
VATRRTLRRWHRVRIGRTRLKDRRSWWPLTPHRSIYDLEIGRESLEFILCPSSRDTSWQPILRLRVSARSHGSSDDGSTSETTAVVQCSSYRPSVFHRHRTASSRSPRGFYRARDMWAVEQLPADAVARTLRPQDQHDGETRNH